MRFSTNYNLKKVVTIFLQILFYSGEVSSSKTPGKKSNNNSRRPPSDILIRCGSDSAYFFFFFLKRKDRTSEKLKAKRPQLGSVGGGAKHPSRLPFCASVQFSRDSFPAFNGQRKIREYI